MTAATTTIIRTKMAKSGVNFPTSAVSGLPPAALSQALVLRLENSEPTAYPPAIAVTTCRTVGITARIRNWAKLRAGLVRTYCSTTSDPGLNEALRTGDVEGSVAVAAAMAFDNALAALLPGVKYCLL